MSVEKYPGTMEELAIELGDLTYDSLAKFLGLLAEKIQVDGDKDLGRGRKQLAGHLHACARDLRACEESIEQAWVICEPFMK